MTIEERKTAEAIQNIAKELKEIRYENEKPLIIDWEQRRYEIAKEIFTRCLSSSDGEMRAFCARHLEMHANDCVREADALIEELKKPKI